MNLDKHQSKVKQDVLCNIEDGVSEIIRCNPQVQKIRGDRITTPDQTVSDNYTVESVYTTKDNNINEQQVQGANCDCAIGSNTSVTRELGTEDGYLNRRIADYGTDYKSISSEHQPTTVSQAFTTSQNMSQEDETAPATVGSMRKLLEELKSTWKQEVVDELKADNEKVLEEVSGLKSKHDQLEKELKNAQVQLKLCQVQLNEVTGISVKQEHEIQECKENIDDLKSKAIQDLLRIEGIVPTEKENRKQVVKTFFKEVLEIEREIPILDAYRVGKGDFKPMIVQLQNHRDKGLIYKNSKNLKDKTNSDNQPYYINDVRTPRNRANNQRIGQLLSQNRNLYSQYQLDMKREKGVLYVEGTTYVKDFQPPSCREILMASKSQWIERLNQDVIKGVTKSFQNQHFTGYTAPVKDIQEANVVYAKVCALHTDARHVVGAVRVPGRRFHKCQGFCDHDEHGAGAMLLNLLLDAGIQNRAIFVVRVYDSTHIGPKRFTLMKDAVKSALDRSPGNKYTGKHDTIWDLDITDAGTEGASIRGRRRGWRGGDKNSTRAQTRVLSLVSGIEPDPATLMVGAKGTFAQVAKLRVSTDADRLTHEWADALQDQQQQQPHQQPIPVQQDTIV